MGKKLALVLQVFPGKTENFIYRELLALSRRQVQLVAVSLQSGNPDDWDNMDGGEALRSLPQLNLERPWHEQLCIHLHGVRMHPVRYFKMAWQAIHLHHGPRLQAARQFLQAVMLADGARQYGIEHFHAGFANHIANIVYLAAGMLGKTYSLAAHAHDIWVQKPLASVMTGATCCVACTHTGQDALTKNYPKAKIVLIRHGIRIPNEPDCDESAKLVSPPDVELRMIAAGRFVPKKGMLDLIEACKILDDQGYQFSCDLYGEGPLKPELQECIQHAGLEGQVRLHPFMAHQHLIKRIRDAHLCVLPCCIDSRTGDRDGIPNVLLEAMACGTIVIGGDLPALREIIQHGVTGYLATPERPAELARTIMMAYAEREKWPWISRQVRQLLIKDYDINNNIVTFMSNINVM